MLTNDTLRTLAKTAVDAGLDRAVLFAGVAHLVRATIPQTGRPFDQMYLDLCALNKPDRGPRGEHPLIEWLKTAEWAASDTPEEAVFRSARLELERALDAAKKGRRLDVAPPSERGPVGESDPTHTSIILDRITQWSTLVERCKQRDTEHLVFLVHGSMEQDIHLFLRRIQAYFNEACQWTHSHLKVERTKDGTKAKTADEWKRCLVAGSRVRRGDLDFVLKEQAAKEPALVVFNETDGPIRGVDKALAMELVKLLCSQIDPVLASLSQEKKLKHPVRFVLPIEHPAAPVGKMDPWVDLLASAISRARCLRLISLPALELPSWADVEHHIRQDNSDVDLPLIQACKNLHSKALATAGTTLQSLGDALDSLVNEWKETNHYVGR
ncbi:MAG: hypothetical protein IPK82_34950 [Polyangiaceae bacterium]|nr:hypothetical protein [Polyangiaceae bacterium]